MVSDLKNRLQPRILYIFLGFFLFTLEVSGLTSAIEATEFERNTAFDNHTCHSQDILFNFTRHASVFWCAHLCAEYEACQTIFFNEKEKTCHGCTARYSDTSLPQPSPGFQHLHKDKKACENGWTMFQDSCYKLSVEGTFQEGVTYCEEKNAHPVYIESSEENDFMETFLPMDAALLFWYIGITDSAQNDVWRYYGTNVLVNYLNFGQTQPDDDASNSQQCGLIIGGYGFDFQWADHYCIHLFPTICEKEL